MGDIILLDTETNSVSNDQSNEVIEIAWKVFQRNLTDPKLYIPPRTMNMRPDTPCIPAAVVIHGLTQEKINTMTPIRDVLPSLVTEFDRLEAEGATFASYNTEFDITILANAYKKYLGKEFKPSKVLDVLRMAKKMVDAKVSGNHKLDTVYYHYALLNGAGDRALHTIHQSRAKHGAGIDVSIAEVVLNKLWDAAEKVEGKPLDVAALLEYSLQPILLEEWPWGQHRGRKVEDVFDNDYQYVEWFLCRCGHRDKHPDLIYTLNVIKKSKRGSHPALT